MDPLQGNTSEPPPSDWVFTKLERIAALAEQMPQTALRTLSHCLDRDLLWYANRLVRPDAAVGVDGQTYEDFQEGLLERLDQLVDEAHQGTYRAPPVRRTYIPKGTGNETRPLGMPTVADKVLQRAVVMILESIYEQDFHEGSHGFRKKRSAHQALDMLRNWLHRKGGGFVLDVDVRKYFDTIDHGHLREFLKRRVADGVLLRLIGKWLKAGVLEEGALSYPDEGTPQGGVISPLLANIYLHYVLDMWFEEKVKPMLKGEAILIRFADDFVLGFTDESDSQLVHELLGPRFAAYGLTIHPEKTRLVRFKRPSGGSTGGQKKPGTFDFLGFTLHWGRTRRGGWTVKTRTASSRIRRTITRIDDWCRKNRHGPVPEQRAMLNRKLHGHYNYFGRPGNYSPLSRVYRGVLRVWKKWLTRRSRASRVSFTWKRFEQLESRHPLATPRIRVGVVRAKP
jgi:RNA-directed DNA polymerase